MIYSNELHSEEFVHLEDMVDDEVFEKALDGSIKAKTYLTGTTKPKIICVSGLLILSKGVGQVWLYPINKEEMKKNTLSLVRELRADIKEYTELHNLHRLHTPITEEFVKWIELIGFKRESVLEKFGADKENQYMYKIII